MRPLIIPFAIWVGVLQAPFSPDHGVTAVLATASALTGLTVLVYRLGVWRAEMQHTKHNVGAELVRFREESRADFARLERRLAGIERFIAQDRTAGDNRALAGTDGDQAGNAGAPSLSRPAFCETV